MNTILNLILNIIYIKNWQELRVQPLSVKRTAPIYSAYSFIIFRRTAPQIRLI